MSKAVRTFCSLQLLERKAEVADESAFRNLKGILSSESVLARYDPKRPLVLSCDAPPVGVGAVLSHKNDDGAETPIAYA